MKVRFKKVHPMASMPRQGTTGSAGFDLKTIGMTWNEELQVYEYDTGIAVEIPQGYVGLVFSRSSVYTTGLILSNGVGVIDSDYRGEIKAKFFCNEYSLGDRYDVGDRVVQLVILPIPAVEFVEVDELSVTQRGAGGYGSTGR